MVIGANPTEAHPVFASQMKRRLREGARLIVVDPRRIELVRSPHVEADLHLPLRPGTNVVLMNAFAHVVVTEGLVDEDFVEQRCDMASFREWREFAARPEHAPEAVADEIGVPAEDIRAAARLYASGGNAAIYYGLGVTEHSQGSTMVMAMANLAMATGNIGRFGRGREPAAWAEQRAGLLRHGLVPARAAGLPAGHATTRCAPRSTSTGAFSSHDEPGFRIPNMLDAAVAGEFKGIYIQGEDIAQSDPNTQHVEAALEAMECVIVQDLFLNETAKFAHVFLPGTSFLEKDGTFINAERRINRVRPVTKPLTGKAEWEVTQALADALGYPMHYDSASRDHWTRSPSSRPSSPASPSTSSTSTAACSGPATTRAPEGTPIMHVDEFVRGKGMFVLTDYQPTEERANRKFPLLLTTGRILSQYNVGAQTRRTENIALARAGRARDPPGRRGAARHPRRRPGRGPEPQGRDHAARADQRAGGARRRLHHLPPPRDGRQRRSPPSCPTGPPTAPSTRSPRCRCGRPTTAPSGRSGSPHEQPSRPLAARRPVT